MVNGMTEQGRYVPSAPVVYNNTVQLIQNLSECNQQWRIREIQKSLQDSVHVGHVFH
jgi:hypothetical protein